MTNVPTQEEGPEIAIDLAAGDEREIKGRSPWELVRARLLRDKVTMVAMGVSLFFVIVGVLAPLLTSAGILDRSSHDELVQGLGGIPQTPLGGMSAQHPLGVQPGTGVDLLALVAAGITTSLQVALFATLVAAIVGTALGLVAGFAGGWIDWLVSRTIDLILSFPQTLMLLSLQAVLVGIIARAIGLADTDATPKILFMIIVLGFFEWPIFARIVRGQVLSLRQREFIEAARSLGARRGRIYVKELLPHLWAPLLVYVTMYLPYNIAQEAALGFLGVGVNPPRVSLGTLLNDSVNFALPDPAYFIIPGLTVFLMTLAFNLVGDGMRDALDPKAGRR